MPELYQGQTAGRSNQETAPYYEDELTTIYHGDCRVLLPELNLSPLVVVISDPPYGIGINTANRSRGRGKPSDRSVDPWEEQWGGWNRPADGNSTDAE